MLNTPTKQVPRRQLLKRRIRLIVALTITYNDIEAAID